MWTLHGVSIFVITCIFREITNILTDTHQLMAGNVRGGRRFCEFTYIFSSTPSVPLNLSVDSLISKLILRIFFTSLESFPSDDKVEESRLASSFDLTCRAWKDRFGVEYTHCGCPLPGDTIGQRLSRLVGNGKNPSYLIPPKRDDLLAATHPSDHNAVFAFHHKSASEFAQRRRRLKIEKRQQRDLKREQAGKLDRRNVQHDPAFLVPVPLYYSSAMVGCAAFSGGVINGGVGFGGCAAVRDFCVRV